MIELIYNKNKIQEQDNKKTINETSITVNSLLYSAFLTIYLWLRSLFLFLII